MTLFKTIQLATVATLFTAMQAHASSVVIVHPSNGDALNPELIAKIFLGKKKSFPSGTGAIPVNLTAGSSTKSDFLSTILKKNESQNKAYWSKLLFTGKGTPPQEVASDAEVIALVAKNPSVIGYVNADSADGTVKVVHTF